MGLTVLLFRFRRDAFSVNGASTILGARTDLAAQAATTGWARIILICRKNGFGRLAAIGAVLRRFLGHIGYWDLPMTLRALAGS
jgi:hypothetical protein